MECQFLFDLCGKQEAFGSLICLFLTLPQEGPGSRAPENLKLAGNWPKVAAMCGLQNYQKSHIFVVFKLVIPITVVFMHFLLAFRPIWLATSISCSSFWLVDTYFWSYFSWLAKSGCQNLKLAGNTFPPFPPFWSPGSPCW